MDWNKPHSIGWGDLRDWNATCKKVIDRMKPYKVIQAEPEYVDINYVVSEVVKVCAWKLDNLY